MSKDPLGGYKMKKDISKKEKLCFYIDSETHRRLLSLASKTDKTKSEIARNFLIEGLTMKTTRDDLDFICRVISKQIEAVLKSDIERIISLIVKDILSSQNTNYLCIELLRQNNTIMDIREIKEKAEAVIKTKEETSKQDITQTIEGQKFLDSEVGAELIENVLAWDKALAQGNEEKVKECITYWRGMQAALKYFTGVNYHFARTKMSCGIIKENEYWLFKIR